MPRQRGPAFGPTGVVVLAELSAREKEEWYDFLLRENVECYSIGEGRYMADVRIVPPDGSIQRAMPPAAPSSQRRKRSTRATGEVAVTEHEWPEVVTFGKYTVELEGYDRVLSLLHEPQPPGNLRPRPLPWLLRAAEALYDLRFAHDVAELNGEIDVADQQNRSHHHFPAFILYSWLRKVHGLRSLMDQGLWDLTLNAAVHREHSHAAELFASFLTEHFDSEDLLFFLYLRSVVEKALRVSLHGRWPHDSGLYIYTRNDTAGGNAKAPSDLFLSPAQCKRICAAVFGAADEPYARRLLDAVHAYVDNAPSSSSTDATHEEKSRVKVVEPAAAKKRPAHIEVYEFLLLAVQRYHDDRDRDMEELGDLTRTQSLQQRMVKQGQQPHKQLVIPTTPHHVSDPSDHHEQPRLPSSSHEGPHVLQHNSPRPSQVIIPAPRLLEKEGALGKEGKPNTPNAGKHTTPTPQRAASDPGRPAPVIVPTPQLVNAEDTPSSTGSGTQPKPVLVEQARSSQDPTAAANVVTAMDSRVQAYQAAVSGDAIAALEQRAAQGVTPKHTPKHAPNASRVRSPPPCPATQQDSPTGPPVDEEAINAMSPKSIEASPSVPRRRMRAAPAPPTPALPKGPTDTRPVTFENVRTRLEKAYVDELMEEVDAAQQAQQGIRGRSRPHADVVREMRVQLSSRLHTCVTQHLQAAEDPTHRGPSGPTLSAIRETLQEELGGRGSADRDTQFRIGLLQAVMLDPTLRAGMEDVMRALLSA